MSQAYGAAGGQADPSLTAHRVMTRFLIWVWILLSAVKSVFSLWAIYRIPYLGYEISWSLLPGLMLGLMIALVCWGLLLSNTLLLSKTWNDLRRFRENAPSQLSIALGVSVVVNLLYVLNGLLLYLYPLRRMSFSLLYSIFGALPEICIDLLSLVASLALRAYYRKYYRGIRARFVN